MAPLLLVALTASAAGAFAWIASLVSGDTSWVDRSWSILPVIYVWEFAVRAGLSNVRLNVMAIVVTAWGVRLTFNFARKGGYSGVEDYRWAALRARMSRWQFQLFNVFFIVLYQNALLVLISLPALTAFDHRSTPFAARDAVLAAVFLGCTVGETIADQQQWDFQQWKRREADAGRDPHPRFAQFGLFHYSRHPHYFFEQAQWWTLFFMGAVAARSVLQWTVFGPLLLSVLFIGSTRFTEQITLSRYPEYADYQRRTSCAVPWFSRGHDCDVRPPAVD